MKKLKLKALELGANELLTREQLKNVMAGDGSGTGSGCPPNEISCSCLSKQGLTVTKCVLSVQECWNAC